MISALAERLPVVVGFFGEAVDGSLQDHDGVEHAPVEPAVDQHGKEPFDGVDPGCRGRR